MKTLPFIILMFAATSAFGQYQAATWPLSYYHLMLKVTGDTFERDSLPSITLGDGPYGYLANSSVSDSAGNLQLYSFGNGVQNKYGDWVTGGCCICQNPSVVGDCDAAPHPQGALFLPRPRNNSQCYLFIKDMDTLMNSAPQRLTATLIDTRANNDSGEVIFPAVPILNDLLSNTRMTACQHANGRDWWLINHQYITNKIYTHLVTPDSIFGPFEQNIGAAGIVPEGEGWGLFSPNLNTYAYTTGGMGVITFLDFDRCNGVFSNPRAINTINGDSGNYFNIAFSPGGRFLYASNSNWLVQYDLQDSDIAASQVQLVHDTAPYPLLGQMVLMPNGKIYQVGWTISDSMLSVIDNPEVKGLGCGFHLRSVLVPNSLEMINVPNFPNYNLGPVVGGACDTLNKVTSIADVGITAKILPNPADNYISVEMGLSGNYEFDLLNVSGQLVYKKETRQVANFDTEQLAEGLYFIRVIDKTTGVKVASKKVVLMH